MGFLRAGSREKDGPLSLRGVRASAELAVEDSVASDLGAWCYVPVSAFVMRGKAF
jgi:hypothetical protein